MAWIFEAVERAEASEPVVWQVNVAYASRLYGLSRNQPFDSNDITEYPSNSSTHSFRCPCVAVHSTSYNY